MLHMSCTYQQGVVFCQTDPVGAAAAVVVFALAVALAFVVGRNVAYRRAFDEVRSHLPRSE